MTKSIPKLTMLVGLSGSGKSTYAYKLYKMNRNNTVIVSSDEVRQAIWGTRTIQDRPDLVFEICHKSIIANLQKGRDVIFDATNLRSKDRRNFLSDIRKAIDAWCECHVLVVPIEKCIENDEYRISVIAVVGEGVIQKQAHKFQIPFKEEGWDEIKLIPQDGYHFNEATFWRYSLNIFFKAANGFDQHTPYHNLTLLEHAEKHEQFVSNYISNTDLDNLPNGIGRALTASILHDYGKIFTHTEDENGIWHYYGHAEYGAYKLLTDTLYPDIILTDKELGVTHENYLNAKMPSLTEEYLDAIQEIMDVVFFVNYHMLPFDWKTDKVKRKYKNIFGEDKFNCLMIMHEADCNGKDLKEGEVID